MHKQRKIMNSFRLFQFLVTALGLCLAEAAFGAQNIFVANYLGNTVSEFDSTGNLINATFVSGVNKPSGMAFDKAGHLYVANQGGVKNTVSEFDTNGTLITDSFIPGLNTPEGLAFDTNGNFFVVNSGDNQVLEFDSSGQNLIRTISSTNFDHPIGVAFDRSGNFYVANRHNGLVLKFDSGGNPVNGGIFASNLDDPEDLAFDSLGRLYVASLTDDTVSQFDADGHLLNANFASGLNQPIGVAFDNDGNLYVANSGGNTASKFSSTGSLIDATFISGLNFPSYIVIQGISLPVSEPAPTLTVTQSGGAVTVAWPLTPEFILQQTSDLTAGNWTVSNYPISTNGAVESITIASPTGNLFFRLIQIVILND